MFHVKQLLLCLEASDDFALSRLSPEVPVPKFRQ